ncbi:MAG: hypothetical protein L0H94_06865, partial [Nitrospira sp.]|nr:hypothetical protein [Nitrospira sp.]
SIILMDRHIVSAYATQAKDHDLINWAVEIKVRAERRAGEMLKAMPKNTGAKGVGPIAIPKKNSNPTLASQGISLKDSMLWQQVASMPEPAFEQTLSAVQAKGEKLTTKAVLATNRLPNPSTPSVISRPGANAEAVSSVDGHNARVWHPSLT